MLDTSILDQPTAVLRLNVRGRKALLRLGITTVRELITLTADELLAARSFGMTSLTVLRNRLRQYGLALKGEGNDAMSQPSNDRYFRLGGAEASSAASAMSIRSRR